jgi:hypothetical protein
LRVHICDYRENEYPKDQNTRNENFKTPKGWNQEYIFYILCQKSVDFPTSISAIIYNSLMVELVNFIDVQEAYKNKENIDPDMKANFIIPKREGDENNTDLYNLDANQGNNTAIPSLYDKIKEEEQREEQKVDLSSSINAGDLKKDFINAVDARQSFFNS